MGDPIVPVNHVDHQFHVNNVPETFKTLIKDIRLDDLEIISLKPTDSMGYLLEFSDGYLLEFPDTDVNCGVRFEKQNRDWTVTYNENNETTKIEDLEKSIVDHLWFVLRSPLVKLQKFEIQIFGLPKTEHHQKMNTLLPLMFASTDYKLHTKIMSCRELNEDTFLLLLKRAEPGILEEITAYIMWKEQGNYSNMDKIVGTEQWKQAKTIISLDESVFKIADFWHCETFTATIYPITLDDALAARERFVNSADNEKWDMFFNEQLYMDPFKRALSSNLNGANPVIIENDEYFVFTFLLPNTTDRLSIELRTHQIVFKRID